MKANWVARYAWITAACAVFALGFDWCYVPNHMSVGGLTGAAQILSALWPQLPVGTTVLVLNVPLFILGWKKIGRSFLMASLYAMAVSSLMIDGLAAVYTFAPMEPILACLYGGVLVGVSMGLLLRQSATTGGTELAARLLKLRFEVLPIGKLCLILDFTIIAAYALVFRDLTQALYGLVALYICTFVIDRVIYGGTEARVAFIISESQEEITQRLLAYDRGVTLLDGQGAWSQKRKQVILCAFGRRDIVPVKRMIRDVDPDAFVIVCDAHEILGEGFGTYTPGGL